MLLRTGFGAAALLFVVTSFPRTGVAVDSVVPGKEWEARSPRELRLDGGKLEKLRERLSGRGCVVRGGYLAFSWGDASLRADVASASKPVVAHFLFKAIEEKKIRSLDDEVRALEPRLEGLNAALGWKDRKITWRHLATQTSCYGVTEPPGTAFDYNDWQLALLWDLLFLKVWGAAYETADRAMLGPMLLDEIGCQDSPTFLAFGSDDRPGRLSVSVRDFARFGLLYLRKGSWGGKPIISAASAARMVSSPLPGSFPRTAGKAAEMLPGQRTLGSKAIPDDQTDHAGSYSFLWWTNGVDREGKRHWPGVPSGAYAALGHGGRRALVVIPELDLVASWNDARVEGREAVGEAIALLASAAE